MSSADDIFDLNYKYLFLFVAVVTTAYFLQDSANSMDFRFSVPSQSKSSLFTTPKLDFFQSSSTSATSTDSRIDLGSSTYGECFKNKISSDNGTVIINGTSFNTNWRKVLFKECVESGDKHYLIAKAIGNNAVGYLVYDDIDNSSNTTSYGCVLHNEFKIIKKRPADFLNVDCSPKGLERLR